MAAVLGYAESAYYYNVQTGDVTWESPNRAYFVKQ